MEEESQEFSPTGRDCGEWWGRRRTCGKKWRMGQRSGRICKRRMIIFRAIAGTT